MQITETGICNQYHFRGNRKKILINMRRAVAAATGGSGGDDGGTEGRELFEGIVIVGVKLTFFLLHTGGR